MKPLVFVFGTLLAVSALAYPPCPQLPGPFTQGNVCPYPDPSMCFTADNANTIVQALSGVCTVVESDETILTTAVRMGGDIGGTPTAPQVNSTHLASPLPATQGGLGQVQPTCSAGQFLTCNGSTCSCVDVGGLLPPWAGQLVATTGNGEPGLWQHLGNHTGYQGNEYVSAPGPSPYDIGSGVARCVSFNNPSSFSVAAIRLWGQATQTGGYQFGIYPRTAGSPAVWLSGTIGAVTGGAWFKITANLPVSLAAGEYWWCVSNANSTSGTYSFRSPAGWTNTNYWAAGDVPPFGGPGRGAKFGIPYYTSFPVASGVLPSTLGTFGAINFKNTTVPVAFLDASATP